MDEERRRANDELLGRMDEKLESLNREITENVKPDVKEIRVYNKEQNGNIIKALKLCAANEARSKMNTRLIIFAISLSTGLAICGVAGVFNGFVG